MPERLEHSPEEEKAEIFQRVTQHSQDFDTEVSRRPKFAKVAEAMVEKYFVIQDWKVGDSTVRAIGLNHTPETFLHFRQEIEKAIEDSDLVVSEWTPEACGWFDKDKAAHLAEIKSKFNPNYNLDQIRRRLLAGELTERERGFVAASEFFHEIELLSAKYEKDVACVDPSSQDVERDTSSLEFCLWSMDNAEDKKAFLKEMSLLGIGAGTILAGMEMFRRAKKESKKGEGPNMQKIGITRRKFLGAIIATAGVATGVVGPALVKKNNSLEEVKKNVGESVVNKKMAEDASLDLQPMRNAYIADCLKKLSEKGYKKITFIYGQAHIDPVKEYIDDPEKAKKNLEIVKRISPDSFRIYRLSPGNNNSERFVASEQMVWQRVE